MWEIVTGMKKFFAVKNVFIVFCLSFFFLIAPKSLHFPLLTAPVERLIESSRNISKFSTILLDEI